MSKRQLSAKEILQDIRSGMDDAALMEKYQLSSQGLQSVFTKLVAAGVVKQAEVDQRPPSHERTVNFVWKCPACGKPQPREFDECPDCGVIVSKFLKKSGRQKQQAEGKFEQDAEGYPGQENSQRTSVTQANIVETPHHSRSSEIEPSPQSPFKKGSFISRACIIMIVGGLVMAAYFFFFFDTSVQVPTTYVFGQTVGGRVNNLGLMAERQNGILFGLGVAILGAVIGFLSGSGPSLSWSRPLPSGGDGRKSGEDNQGKKGFRDKEIPRFWGLIAMLVLVVVLAICYFQWREGNAVQNQNSQMLDSWQQDAIRRGAR